MQKTKENPKQSAIIFLKKWRLAKFTLTLNALKKMKKILCLAHQYLTFLIKLGYKDIVIDCLDHSLLVLLGQKIVMLLPEKWFTTTFNS